MLWTMCALRASPLGAAHRQGFKTLICAPTTQEVFCFLRGGVGLEYDLVSLGLHCFLRLERALCWRSG